MEDYDHSSPSIRSSVALVWNGPQENLVRPLFLALRRRWGCLICLAIMFCFSCSDLAYAENQCWAQVQVDSDPVEAHVYGKDGSYWGMTSDKEYVVQNFQKKHPCDSEEYSITLKKRGYKATKHTFTLYYADEYYWEQHERKAQLIMVVLDSESD